MHPPGTRVLPPVALPARVPPSRVHRRPFFAWSGAPPPGRNGTGDGAGNNSGGGSRPAQEPLTGEDAETQPATDTAGGRSRSHAATLQRTRQARKRAATALPPVKLPQSFLDNNVSLFRPSAQPQIPLALAHDAKIPKVSRLFNKPDPNLDSDPHNDAIEFFFQTATDVLLENEAQSFDLIERIFGQNKPGDYTSWHRIADMVRTWDMIIDSAWHLTDALYPARQAEYIYKKRPFWWWHYYRDYDRRDHGFGIQPQVLSSHLSLDFRFHMAFDYSLAHVTPDLPVPVFRTVEDAIHREMKLSAPQDFDAKTSKRQLTVLSLTGYSGKSIPEAVGKYTAKAAALDLVQLDAYDLSMLVGDYLGQNWAYSRGPLSMLGFRAAELNGKLARDPDITRSADDDDPDPETAFINVRASPGQIDEELQKIKQGSYECFGKWDNLKIDKILDQIIRAEPAYKPSTHVSNGKLIHIHDFVELSMTLEGAWLIGRLRALVDAAWQQGEKIAILGTSSTESPSDEYQNMVRDLAVEDLVISRHVEPDRAHRRTRPDDVKAQPQFRLQKADIFVENIQNVNRMLKAMDPDSRDSIDIAHMLDTNLELLMPFGVIHESVLPAPEVYNIAMAFRSMITVPGEDGASSLVERGILGKLRDRPGVSQPPVGMGADSGGRFEAGDQPKANEEAASEKTPKLTEYERRIAAGQINRENLKTTFADVHAPPETISALKLLTSLALTRPDAFSYGVLASDKIPGCLLYGPPGTGKTMLAKAVAKESGANMLEVSGATINDKWVGEGEKLIRAVFTLAKKLSPCVVFIDEADSLLASRSMFSRASHRELINQFLKEWDGIQETNAFIMVATNRPFDLDDAVLRRLPRKILVDLPMRDDRAAILKLLLRGETLDASVALDEYAERTPFYSGSDLKNVCVAAAMAAVEEENEAANKHEGPEPYQYPQKRTLRRDHFELALKQIPASISENMLSLKQIRKFDEEYGRQRKGGKKSIGFGILEDQKPADSGLARIRQGPP